MLERIGWAARRRCASPHTKWAWRRTAKWVICEVGLSVNGEHRDCLIYARATSPDVGWQRCWIGFLPGLGWEESLLQPNFPLRVLYRADLPVAHRLQIKPRNWPVIWHPLIANPLQAGK
jgi:hypothetical protein